MKQMILKASTNNVGSECEVELGISEDEWNSLSELEQTQMVNEMKFDIMDMWVEAI